MCAKVVSLRSTKEIVAFNSNPSQTTNNCWWCGGRPHRHQPPQPCAEKAPSAFPSEILPDFLYLGTYDHSSRAEVLRAIGIKDCLNVSHQKHKPLAALLLRCWCPLWGVRCPL